MAKSMTDYSLTRSCQCRKLLLLPWTLIYLGSYALTCHSKCVLVPTEPLLVPVTGANSRGRGFYLCRVAALLWVGYDRGSLNHHDHEFLALISMQAVQHACNKTQKILHGTPPTIARKSPNTHNADNHTNQFRNNQTV